MASSFVPFRTVVGSEDDNSGFQPIREVTLPPPPKGGFISDIKRGTGQVVEAVGSTLQDVGADEVGQAIEGYGRGVVRRNPSEIGTFGEALSSPLTTAREAVGELVPQIGTSLGAGLAGRVVGGVLGLPFGPAGVAAGQTLGAAGGAYLGNLVQEYGGIRTEQREQGIEDKTRALATGGAAAVLDTAFGAERIANRFLKEGSDILARQPGSSLLKQVGKQGAIGFGIESVTEGAQTGLERYGAYKPLTGDEAYNEYGLAMLKGGIGGGVVRGGLAAVAGEQTPPGGSLLQGGNKTQDTNAIQQAFDQPQTSGTPLTNVTPPPAPPITPSADTTPPPAPIVSGGTTPIAQATQQAQAEDQQVQAALDAQTKRENAFQSLGAIFHPEVSGGALTIFGQSIAGPQINTFGDALASKVSALPPQAVTIANAIAQANQMLVAPGKPSPLVSFTYSGDNPLGSANKVIKALEKTTERFQIGHVQSVDEAAAILNLLSKSAKSTQLDQINAIHAALTGKDTEGYIASQTSKPKGKSNVQQQQQVSSGLGTVPVQGGTIQGDGGLTGLLQPGAVQPVGTGVVSGAANDQQAGQLPGEGIRTGPSVAAADDIGGAAQAPQVTAPAPDTNQLLRQVFGGNYAIDESVPPATISGPVRVPGSGGAVRVQPQQTPSAGVPGSVPESVGGERVVRRKKRVVTPAAATPSGMQFYSTAIEHIHPTKRSEIVLALLVQALETQGKVGGGDNQLSAITRAQIVQLSLMEQMTAQEIAIALATSDTPADVKPDTIQKQRTRLGIKEDESGGLVVDTNSAVGKKFLSAFVEAAANFKTDAFPDGIGPEQLRGFYAAKNTFNDNGTVVELGELVEESASRTTEVKLQEELYRTKTEGGDTQAMGEVTPGGSQGNVDSTKKTQVNKKTKARVLDVGALDQITDLEAEADKLRDALEEMAPKDPRREGLLSRLEAIGDIDNGEIAALWAQYNQAQQIRSKEADEAGVVKKEEQVAAPEELTGAAPSEREDADLEKAAKAEQGETNAVQEPSTEKVSVPEGAAGGQEVGKGVAKVGKATRVRKAKVEKPVETKVEEVTPAVLTPKEQWDALTQQFPGMPPYDVLTKSEKETWDDFANRGFGDIGSVATVLGGADKIAKASEAVTETVVEAAPPAAEPVAETAAPTTQQSRANQPVVERYTAEELQTSLLDYVNRESLGKDVFVVDELEDLRSLPEFAAMTDEEFANFLTKEKIDGQTQAFVTESGKAYLLASNIDVGTGRGVFMHEVGVHLGLQEKLPDASFARLVDQIKVWAKLNDGSIENQLAIAASDRVFQSRVSDPVQRRREFVAYFVEAAVNAGLDPKAYENIKSAGLREWMRSLWAAFKNALRKLRGINVDKLSAQDVVDMAYGYAQMAIGAPKFQGSGKIFRKFQMKFAGTGVGQMYGHGMYFTNKPEVAASFAKGKTPQLYGADLAVTDDELMGWATPLSQQSATVQQATADAAKELGVVTGQNVRGGNFYSDLGEQLYKKATGKNITTKAQVSESQRMASEWLDAHGVKGIKYGGDNYVVFNEDNIIRVNRTPGAPTGRMDKGRPEVEWGSVQQSRRVDAAVNLLPPKLRAPVKSTTTNLLYQAKQGVLASAITEDVINMASKFMKSAKTYLAAQYARQATRLNHELKIDKILTQFDKLPKNLQGTGEGSVNKYIFDSTREGKWGYIPDERMVGTTLLTVDPDMKARFDAFPQDAQKLIRNVFEQGYDALDAKQNAIRNAIDREYADRLKAVEGDEELTDKLNKEKKLALSREKKLIGLDSSKPYAYLGRYGDYVVVAKSAEYKAKEDLSRSKDISKAEQERYIAWMAENRSNPAHYVVQFAETLGDADAIAEQLKATGNYDMPESFEKELYANEGADLFLAVARLRTLFDKQSEGANPAAQAAINNLLGDLYLHTVSEASSRKSEFQRLNISGADQDMMRNLATRGRADAHFLAALEHNDAISDAITAMREERNRNRKEASPYFNELLERHADSMKYQTPGVLTSAMLRMSNVWYLATNPAYYLQQILQTGVLSLPYMSGRLGYFRSARAVKKAYGDMATLVKGLGVGDHIDFNKAPADVREMLTKLVGMGKIDIGIDSDARVRAGEAGVAAKVMQKLQGVNNRIEAVNRATAAIAAYRGYLDRYKNGDTVAATAYAADVVSNTHGSYDAFNTPRLMQGGVGKVLLQFKRFQIIQISMLLKLINTAFKGASREEKAVARRALGFIAGHMMVLGGALAVPFVTQFGSLLLKAFGDEEEPENLELTLRRLINDPVMADLLINGVPGALGVNLGGKIGLGNVFSILPFTDIDFTSRSGAEKMIVGVMGPSVGLGLKFADGLGQMASGEYYKGLESMLPSGVANVMKAGRFATEGVTMRNGDVVLKPEEISMFDAAFQAVGLPTTTLTDRQFTQRVVAEFDKFYDKRTTEIKGDYVNASRDGDVNGMADAREEWSKLQESRVKNGYKRQPLSDLFRAPSAAAKRERNIAGGVEFSKSNRRFVESLSTL